MSLTVERTLAGLALRQLVSRKRVLALVAVAAVPVLLALPLRGGMEGRSPEEALAELYVSFVVAVILPIVALVIGNSVFGAEVDDGTILYVLGKPVPRWRIVLTRILASAAAVAAVLVPSTLLCAVMVFGGLDPARLAVSFAVASAVGGLLYSAIFVALSLSSRRALVVGLLYVIVWEGLLSSLFAGTRALSVRQYVVAIADALSDAGGGAFFAELERGTAFVMAAVVGVAATLYAIRRLQRFEIGEAA